jgi:PAS domain S-box-containing protein
MLNAATGQVEPVASFGATAGYLDGVVVTSNADDPNGRGPVGTAIRENRPVWNQDYLNDPATAPWHERAASYGWRAVAALPLHRNGAVVGSFNLYADQAGAFDEDARKLLEEMATDVSYALDGFERDASVRLAAEVFEQGKEGIMITDTRGRIVRVNRAFSEISGYAEAEALGQTAGLLSSGRHGKEFYRAMWDAIDASGHWQGEIWNRRKDGHIFPEWLAISRVLDDKGSPSHYVGIFSDISACTRRPRRASSAWRISMPSPACPTAPCCRIGHATRSAWHSAATSRWRCCSSTSTTSRTSTTHWAIASATSFWSKSVAAWATWCARKTRCRARAATNSSWFCSASMPTMRRTSPRS